MNQRSYVLGLGWAFLLFSCASVPVAPIRQEAVIAQMEREHLWEHAVDSTKISGLLKQEIHSNDSLLALATQTVAENTGSSALIKARTQILEARIRYDWAQELLSARQRKPVLDQMRRDFKRLNQRLGHDQADLSLPPFKPFTRKSLTYRHQWTGFAQGWEDSATVAERILESIDQLEALEVTRLDDERRKPVYEKRIQEMQDSLMQQTDQKLSLAQHETKQLQNRMEHELIQAQERYDELLQKASDRQFLGDQMSKNLAKIRDSMRVLAQTTVQAQRLSSQSVAYAESMQKRYDQLNQEIHKAEKAFGALASLGLEAIQYEDDSYLLPAARVRTLDHSLEILSVFWPESRLDVVYWGDSLAWLDDSSVVADLTRRRAALIEHRMHWMVPSDTLAEDSSRSDTASPVIRSRIELHQCFRQMPLEQNSEPAATEEVTNPFDLSRQQKIQAEDQDTSLAMTQSDSLAVVDTSRAKIEENKDPEIKPGWGYVQFVVTRGDSALFEGQNPEMRCQEMEESRLQYHPQNSVVKDSLSPEIPDTTQILPES